MIGAKSILDNPVLYFLFQKAAGSERFQREYINEYICPMARDRILDLGCGTADVLRYLSDVEYLGVDINQRYIDRAKKVFKDKGTFICANIDRSLISTVGIFDKVCAIGVIHHLNDNEATQLFEVARAVIKPGGKLTTSDTCYADGQSMISRFIASQDKGRHVRTKEEYVGLASRVFSDVKAYIRNDLFRFPITFCIMECKMD